MTNLSFITFPIFDEHPEIFCAFTTRNGGFSSEKYSTINMGLTSGDNIDTVKKNRKYLFELLNIDEERLAIPKQIHSAYVSKARKPGVYTDTDGIYTDDEDIILTIQTADCLPIFMYDPVNRIIAIVHAGWQGAIKGIVINTIQEIKKEYAVNMENFKVAIGPGIQSSCFEIREDVYSKFPMAFLKKHEDTQKKYLDLQSFVKEQLLNIGIQQKNIFIDPTCTHCDNKRYYSYRRDKNHSGRMMGFINFRNALNT